VLAAFLAVERFPRGVAVLAGLLVALAAGWTALRSEGMWRLAAGLTVAALAGAVCSLHWRGPDGEEGRDAVALLVSNNSYRLGTGLGSGTRPCWA
jgi:hypothetical protein